jgi:hypothetical protein
LGQADARGLVGRGSRLVVKEAGGQAGRQAGS